MRNTLPRKSISGYRGVVPYSEYLGKCMWATKYNGRVIRIFSSKEKAARLYDKLVLEEFGEFAYTNFPREDYAEHSIST